MEIISTCHLCMANVVPTGHVCGDRPDIAIGRCDCCGLVQTMDFSHVSIEHYIDDLYFPLEVAPNWIREEPWNLRRIALLRDELPDAGKRRILDFGCGIGGFLQRAQGKFGEVIGFDLSPRIVQMQKDAGMVCFNSLEEVPDYIDTITLFHVLEHVVEPWNLLRDLVDHFPSVDRVVVETPCTEEALLSWYDCDAYRGNHYSADHIYYFSNQTLGKVVEQSGMRVLLSSQLQRYTLGNTLGWTVNARGGGQHEWTAFNAPEFHAVYERTLAKAGVADSVFLICEPVRS